MDVKKSYLNGTLEEVYMNVPPRFEEIYRKTRKLMKSLYGLKQSPRAWLERFAKSIKKYGFT